MVAPVERSAGRDIRSLPVSRQQPWLTAMAIGQAVMVAVMSMTPVHLKHGESGTAGHRIGDLDSYCRNVYSHRRWSVSPATASDVDR